MSRRDTHTPDLFPWSLPKVTVGYGDDVAGKGGLDNQIARVLSRALRDAGDRGMSRHDVAAQLTDELGRKVSKDMVDKWTSEAADRHRVPLDAFVALVRVTGELDLLGFVPGLFGMGVLPRQYEAIVELHLLEEHEQQIASHKARLVADLRARR